MKVLYFTKYSRLGASSRLRSYQYFPFLENAGVEVSVSPLFNDSYLNTLYLGKPSKKLVVIAYLKRFFCLFTVFKYDKIVIEKELFPYFFPWFEMLLSFLGKSYIVDYDDAIFHNYDLSKNRLIRFFLKKKIDYVMRFSQCVIAGNSYLAARASKAGAKNIQIVPTVIDLDRYPEQEKTVGATTIIGWIGSPSTFKYIENLWPVLEQLAQKYSICYHIIGAQPTADTKGCFKFIPWTEATEVDEINRFDIGIMPLNDSLWELGKCSYKLIQYMGCSVPVVASPVGMNKEVVKDGVNGFLVTKNAEWLSALENLILSNSLQHKMGINGRENVEQFYCLQKTNIVMINIFTR